jgi:hypothetical protein
MGVTYVLPIRVPPSAAPDPDLDGYLHALAGWVDEVIVVDGSPPSRFRDHASRWPRSILHVPPARPTRNGKVGGVVTGVAAASHEHVVVADDDVRWTPEQLALVPGLLADADVVRPQQVYVPTPWPARWDTGRMLVHRALGGDWPGTLLLHRGALPPGGYSGDVLFENLELVRTVVAAGGRAAVALGVVVARRPPTTGRLVEQRVRQAYDEWARPGYLVAELALLPLAVAGGRRAVAGMAAGAVALAEVGRRRAGGPAHWPATAPLWAPAWVAERSVTAWLGVLLRLRGGVRYRGMRLRTAAHGVRRLRRTVSDVTPASRDRARWRPAAPRGSGPGGPAGRPPARSSSLPVAAG